MINTGRASVFCDSLLGLLACVDSGRRQEPSIASHGRHNSWFAQTCSSDIEEDILCCPFESPLPTGPSRGYVAAYFKVSHVVIPLLQVKDQELS